MSNLMNNVFLRQKPWLSLSVTLPKLPTSIDTSILKAQGNRLLVFMDLKSQGTLMHTLTYSNKKNYLTVGLYPKSRPTIELPSVQPNG